jgi:hypothetical protein
MNQSERDLVTGVRALGPACAAILAAGVLLLPTLTGCAGMAGSTGAPKLSDAMAAASDSSSTHAVPASTARASDDCDADSTSADFISTLLSLFLSSRPEHPAPESLSPEMREEAASSSAHRYWLTAGGGWMTTGDADLAGPTQAEIRLGTYTSERIRPAVAVAIGWAPVLPSSTIARSLDGPLLTTSIGGLINLYTTPQHTAIGHYFLAGIGLERTWWHYRNTITVNTEHVEGDAIEGLEVSLGTGVNLLQTSGLQLGGEVAVGATGYFATTEEGFANDLFRSRLDLKCTIVASFGL